MEEINQRCMQIVQLTKALDPGKTGDPGPTGSENAFNAFPAS